MSVLTFCSATALGAGLWVFVLAALEFWFGRNEQLVLQNLRGVTLLLVAGSSVGVFYLWRQGQNRAKQAKELSV